MSTPSLTPTAARSPAFSIEIFTALTSASVIGLAWWMGSLGANRQDQAAAACPAGAQVNSAQVKEAVGRVRDAERRARYTALSGSGYAAAKVGLPRNSPEYRLAQEAAQDLAFARQDLARLCGADR
ncbi:MAG: hypothetical protein B7Y99_08165 [Caulobacterales bacterium 32-69-10]|nr:MAG: hypothetical protein B7Y99_08165 [Caulobacterales bacterium 32-69-10]